MKTGNIELSPENIFRSSELSPANIFRMFELSTFSIVIQETPSKG